MTRVSFDRGTEEDEKRSGACESAADVSRTSLARVSSQPRLNRMRFGFFRASTWRLNSCARDRLEETLAGDATDAESVIANAMAANKSFICFEENLLMFRMSESSRDGSTRRTGGNYSGLILLRAMRGQMAHEASIG